jgi:hypothetical protein
MTGGTARRGAGPIPAPVWLRLAASVLHLLVGGGVIAAASVVLEPVLPSQERREALLAWWEPRGGAGMRRACRGGSTPIVGPPGQTGSSGSSVCASSTPAPAAR